MAAVHPHSHDPAHTHGSAGEHGTFTPGEAKQARRLTTVMLLVGAFFTLELAGAFWADSVVLQADALHLLTDLLALGVSLFAMRVAVRRPTPRFTYGLRRAEPLAAITSGLLVLATAGGIVAEGVSALHERTPPRAGIMLAVALMALVVNGLSAWLLHDAIGHGHPHAHDADNPDDHDAPADAPPRKAQGHALNLRGASLHLLGDTLGALAAVGAALVIRFGGSSSADPIASFFVAAILFAGAIKLLRDASLVILESAPVHLPVGATTQVILGFPGVLGLHDLHVWALGAGHDAVTVHVRTDCADPCFGQKLSEKIRAKLGVEYVTVQVEIGSAECRSSPPPAGSARHAGHPQSQESQESPHRDHDPHHDHGAHDDHGANEDADK